jgi:hypothetical protein
MSALGIDELIPIGASFFFCCRREPACRNAQGKAEQKSEYAPWPS